MEYRTNKMASIIMVLQNSATFDHIRGALYIIANKIERQEGAPQR